ncbi:polysaccharide deacetylase family protein [Sphingomonas cannabina]|uniref:polysaccharide deacetylase family protein n=1 Tax=Sphingomonas cannabina TaxID=2899123 RepID=UPI001F2B3F45|nr:polysaccharide deacetylase family protein [Sphingomonas cannabina]UIJ43691.1 polysaccharide deacetylase family protein [Sphingomonas cannabina]
MDAGDTHHPPLPALGDRVRWPADFGQRFTIFVDTEEEFDWSAPLARDACSVRATGAIPAAARRFSETGAALTFLVDHPIVTDPASIEHLRTALAEGAHAVGTQLHPWVNPPFDEAINPRNSFAGNLPRALEAAKLDLLTDAITDAFGQPKVYRAGRYGIGPATLALLAERGYRFDSSIRPGYDYSGEGGPIFLDHGNHAFRTPEGVIELPLTTVYTGRARRGGAALYRIAGVVPKGRGLLARTGLLARVALTPEGMPLSDALEAVRVAAGEGVTLLNFSFHSPSLEPGHTPYVRDAQDLAAFWRWWDAMLTLLDRLGIASASLDEIVAAADAAALARA